MSQYYFTVASLPALMYAHKPSVTESEFLEICETSLSSSDFKVLQSVKLSAPQNAEKALSVLRVWQDWELNLRNTLAQLRAREKGLHAAKFLKPAGDNFAAQRTAHIAFVEESPLKAEDTLDRARWMFLEELEAGHHFDLAKLVIYYLKLQMASRKNSFNKAAGEERYKEIMNKYIELINSRENRYVK